MRNFAPLDSACCALCMYRFVISMFKVVEEFLPVARPSERTDYTHFILSVWLRSGPYIAATAYLYNDCALFMQCIAEDVGQWESLP